MKQVLMLLFVVSGGMALAVEAAFLGPLGESIGRLSASLSIFLIGVLVFSIAMVILMIMGRRNYLSTLPTQPRWLLTAGLVGFTYTIILTITTPLVGVGTTMVGILCGQISASLVIDHFGLLGSARRAIDRYRLAALGLILVALWLIY
ncbi:MULTISPECIES: DMT family transporter [unclassified Psychrobacter]|uniref:DMT family transporter n=1 Tax=unclassified Psychrobacter TaxID=196806 RepID=UPI0025EF1FEE|nr:MULTISPECIES: DMT family transporter [unclassified Psychrobacter]